MDRRTFILDAGGAMLWAAGVPVVRVEPAGATHATLATTGVAPISIAVFDASLAQGRRLARDAARLVIPAFAVEADDDIGALWHARIAPGLMRRTTLAAALRPADAFVLARFAASLDCGLIDTSPDACSVIRSGNRGFSDRT